MKRLYFSFLVLGIFLISGCLPPPPAPLPPPAKPMGAPVALPPMPEFYAHASVELLVHQLPPGTKLGPGRNSPNPDIHFHWAEKNPPHVVKKELIAKFRRVWELKRNHQGKPALAAWYAHVCTHWANFGVNFGNPGANSKDFHAHESWAMRPSVKPINLLNQIIMRINKIFTHY